MKAQKKLTLSATFAHLIFSPKGTIEGVMLTADDADMQIVFDKEDESAAAAFEGVVAGQEVEVEVKPAKPSDKGESAHAVYQLERVRSIEGAAASSTPEAFTGTVVRLNYARHGQPNGVILDTGDFVHTKPHGMAKLALTIGQKVKAKGSARRLSVGTGRVIEATAVNGKTIERR